MIYWQFFQTFFIIGLCSFGGGYAALPFIETMVVEQYGWLNAQQFLDVLTISQMTPGPIGINAATFVGIQVAGTWGAVCATLGFVTPSIIIVLILAHYYLKYRRGQMMKTVLQSIQPAVVALIALSTWNIIQTAFWQDAAITLDTTNWTAVGIAAVMFLLLKKSKMGPIGIIMLSGVLGIVLYSIPALA